MSDSFDWDFVGEPESPHPPGAGSRWPGGRRRRLFWGAALALLLILLGTWVVPWLAKRLTTVDQREAALRAVVDLELKAIHEGDAALFRSLQDPINPTWQERQIARYFSPDDADFSPAPGLIAADRPDDIEQIRFFGRDGRAELIRWFVEPTGQAANYTTIPLPFRVTWFYRLDKDGHWIHVAPPGDTVGSLHVWHGIHLEVRASEIEAEQVGPAAPELTTLVSQACRWVGCSEDDRYTLGFQDVVAPEIRGDLWVLPAPYLTGLPQNGDARIGWGHAVDLWTIERLAKAQAGGDEVTQRLLFRQLLISLQSRLGLAPIAAAELTEEDVDLLAKAARDQRLHPLQSVWEATTQATNPEETRLLEAEVNAFLIFLGDQLGPGRIFQLLPALSRYDSLSSALSALYGLDRFDFNAGWFAHLEELTGEEIAVEPSGKNIQVGDEALQPHATPIRPASRPGDHIVLNCGGRIWVGNADGSDVLSLTGSDQHFNAPHWSPDGRQLLAKWLPRDGDPATALYLMEADGSKGRLLTDDPGLQVWPLVWSPDGGDVIFYAIRFDAMDGDSTPTIQALDVETEEARLVPGTPVWSPSGEHLVYVAAPAQGTGRAAWLADADWQNPRQIAANAWMWSADVWAPDSTRLALLLLDDEPPKARETAIAIYDLTADRISPSVTVTALAEALREALNSQADGAHVISGADPADLLDRPFGWTQLLGWSADGQYLLAWAQATPEDSTEDPLVALAAIPLGIFDDVAAESDGEPTLKLLAYSQGRFLDAAWSPIDPDRLTFSWVPADTETLAEANEEEAVTYMLDLTAGPIYTATASTNAAWSPDGQWVAFGGNGQVTITDLNGQERFQIIEPHMDWCTEIAWNPVADLSRLGEIPPTPAQD